MNTESPIEVSIISSVYNEEGNLASLVHRVVNIMEHYHAADAWEYLLVDDASTDGSCEILKALYDQFPQYLRIVRHPARQGQKGCFMTGFTQARGRIAILMDADLQTLPEELPRVLDEVLLKQREMVCTYNDTGRGGKPRHVVSQLGNLFMKLLFRSPVRNAGANFMAVETRFLRGVRLVANDQRYLLPIAMRRGLWRISEVGCVFGLRAYGRSKYSYWRKMLWGVPEMLALRRRLRTGCYDTPPVPPAKPLDERLVVQLRRVERQLASTVQGPFTSRDRLWAIVRGGSMLAVAAWHDEPWDSEVLALTSGRCVIGWSLGSYDVQCRRLTKILLAVVDDARRQGVHFLSLRISERELAAIHAAEYAGFKIMESYLTFERSPGHTPDADPRVRLARSEDMEPLADLAARAFRHHRYVVDPYIPVDRARQTRRQWVRDAFAGRADAMYVAETDGQLGGFVILRSRQTIEGDSTGVIDLLAIDDEAAGQGLGSALVNQAIQHYSQKGKPVEVGTQGKNVPAIRLYTKLGFTLRQTEFSLHWRTTTALRESPEKDRNSIPKLKYH